MRTRWKVALGIVALLVGVSFAWPAPRAYLCRPSMSVDDCEKEQGFGSFSSELMCIQAADNFCIAEHSNGRADEFRCVRKGETVYAVGCSDEGRREQYPGAVSSLRPYPHNANDCPERAR